MEENVLNSLLSMFSRCEDILIEGDKVVADQNLSQFIESASFQLKRTPILYSPCTQNQLRCKLALAHNNRGLLKYYTVDFEMAVQDFTAAISYNNKLAQAYYNRGLIYYRLGNFNEAITDLHSSLTLDPGFLSAHQCLENSITERNKRSNHPYLIV